MNQPPFKIRKTNGYWRIYCYNHLPGEHHMIGRTTKFDVDSFLFIYNHRSHVDCLIRNL